MLDEKLDIKNGAEYLSRIYLQGVLKEGG